MSDKQDIPITQEDIEIAEKIVAYRRKHPAKRPTAPRRCLNDIINAVLAGKNDDER